MHNLLQHLAPSLQHETCWNLFLLFERCIFLGFHLLKWNWGIRKLRLFSNNGIILKQMDSPRDRNNLLYLQNTSLNTDHSVCWVLVSTSLLPKLRDLKPPCLRSYITSDDHRKPLHSSVVPHTSDSHSPQISRALSFKIFSLWSSDP